ncbi:hypothetical protein DSUL_20513 [Desulfovibrionales bacterium]
MVSFSSFFIFFSFSFFGRTGGLVVVQRLLFLHRSYAIFMVVLGRKANLSAAIG